MLPGKSIYPGTGQNVEDDPRESTQWDLLLHERQLFDFGMLSRTIAKASLDGLKAWKGQVSPCHQPPLFPYVSLFLCMYVIENKW
jgi:hypothetical protein